MFFEVDNMKKEVLIFFLFVHIDSQNIRLYVSALTLAGCQRNPRRN